jgi:hypothetical protein
MSAYGRESEAWIRARDFRVLYTIVSFLLPGEASVVTVFEIVRLWLPYRELVKLRRVNIVHGDTNRLDSRNIQTFW